jgi:hypothetical protein
VFGWEGWADVWNVAVLIMFVIIARYLSILRLRKRLIG